jgi:hypothetical protein
MSDFDDIFATEAVSATADNGGAADTPLTVAVAAVVSTLETTCFIDAVVVDATGQTPSTPLDLRVIRMTFGGPCGGELALYADAALGREIAANCLGLDVSAPEAEAAADDSLRELTNVAGGAMMPGLVELLHPEQAATAQCPLGLPDCRAGNATDWSVAVQNEDVTFLDTGSTLLGVRLTMHAH